MSKKPKRLVILSDSPTSGTGLGRITKDLATRIAIHMPDVYRVLTVGYGGVPSPDLPFPQYVIKDLRDDWIFPSLHEVWKNWVGDEEGILLVVWDASRLSWLADPNTFGELTEDLIGLQQWIKKRPFKLWGYLPIDASGPNDRMTFPLMRTLLGFDRLLAYGEFGEGVIRRTIGDEESEKRHLTNLPHGLNSDVFFELPRHLCRKLFFRRTGAQPLINMEVPPIADDEVLIGCICTNQPRKDWSLACETIAILSKTHKVRFWAHTDHLERAWSIPALCVDYGIIDKTVVSLGHLSDNSMAEGYSACDLTIAPGLGEGFGFPIFESMFCGTPVVHGDFGGAPEWMAGHVQGLITRQANDPFLVKPIAYRHEGVYACQRPVFSAQDWATKAEDLISKRVNHNGEIDWQNLWPRWETYLRKAAE